MEGLVNFGKLIIDDDIETNDLIRDILKDSGLGSDNIITNDPDFFIMNLKLADINVGVIDHYINDRYTGYDILKELKRNKWSYAIIMSGQKDMNTVIKYMNSGANKYINKNWDEDEIKDVLGSSCPQRPTYIDVLVHFLKEAIGEAKERIDIYNFIKSLKK